jgi:hypothetical protein
MRYPTINRAIAIRLLEEIFLEELDPDIDGDDYCHWTGQGHPIDLTELEGKVNQIQGELPESMSDPRKDVIEGGRCGILHSALVPLEDVCFEAHDDPGFWCYLSFKHFLPLISWRHAGTFTAYKENSEGDGNLENVLKYIYDPTLREGVISRMYIRAHIAREEGDYTLAEARDFGHPKVGNGDLWRSHITRVRTGESTEIAKALVRLWNEDEGLTTEKPGGGLRVLGKLINRQRSNVTTTALDRTAAESVVEELASRLRQEGN